MHLRRMNIPNQTRGFHMNYTQKSKIKQDSATKNIVSDAWIGIIMLPSRLVGFTNYETTIEKTTSGRDMYLFRGDLQLSEDDATCPECGSKMHVHGSYESNLRHLCFGSKLSCVCFDKVRYYCPHCGYTQNIPSFLTASIQDGFILPSI